MVSRTILREKSWALDNLKLIKDTCPVKASFSVVHSILKIYLAHPSSFFYGCFFSSFVEQIKAINFAGLLKISCEQKQPNWLCQGLALVSAFTFNVDNKTQYLV